MYSFKEYFYEDTALDNFAGFVKDEYPGWDDWLKTRKHKWNEDGTVDIVGSVYLFPNGIDNITKRPLTKLPFKFGRVTGVFSCINNQLISLEGAPRKVGGDFMCSFNQLTTLEGAPRRVDEDFYCGGNPGNFTEEQVRAVCEVGKGVYV